MMKEPHLSSKGGTMMKITWKWIAWICLIVDICITLKFTWLRESILLLYKQLTAIQLTEVWQYLESNRCNIVPFRTIFYFILHSDSFRQSILNLGGNVWLFMPLGFLLPIVTWDDWRGKKQFWGGKLTQGWYVTLVSFSFSLLIETGQLLMEVGSFDVDDLILNTLGGWIGFRVLIIFFRTTSRYNGYAYWKERGVEG
jgi:glycopeptide antibiotics resistance protein